MILYIIKIMETSNLICDLCNSEVSIADYPTHLLQCLQTNTVNEVSYVRSSLMNLFNAIDIPHSSGPTTNQPFVVFQVSMSSFPPIVLGNTIANSLNDYEFNTMLGDMIGKVEIGLTARQKDKISLLLPWNLYPEEKCPICLDDFKEKKENIRRLLCNHTFCDECIGNWFRKHKKCPCCLVDLHEKYIEQSYEKIE